ncbi:hypothetical protein [Myxococcus sp. RHSTA-1-4]|uniref:DUF7151 family protein n=1 Tax=Myxococcus sp. RHSTA-1-4 TaxID=2874601 RepID=UPI001CBC39BD|nr:hypothetical protein [Myxococcus sp. RHSTA-1-4]MBZ4416056.1 hypothetical protein [Myxococcus sp. RHSTA-1-4]
MRWTWMAVFALAAGCNGIELEKLVKQHPALTRLAPEPAGAHCPHGGQAVLSGLDLDENGVLDDSEVTNTEYACTTALAYSQPEAAGAHCEHGGQAVRTGPDLDGDGELDDAEVTATEYVCATAVPDVLVRTRQVPPGEHCPNGGVVSHAGKDLNGDGLLGDAEITREVYGCSEPAPVLTRVRLLTRAPFVCQQTSSIVDAALDLDRDGVFDDEEARASTRVCVDPALVRVRQRPEPAGTRCPMGGIAVEAGRDMNGDGVFDSNEVLGTAYVCQPTSTYDGSYLVQDAADFAALGAISHIRGGLTITNTQLTEVVLPGLVSVEGSLSITSNAALTRVELMGLRSVGEALFVGYNDNLELLTIGPAGPAPEHAVHVGTNLGLSTNPKLQTLFGLAAVSPRGSFTVTENALLMGGDRFPYLEELSGTLSIWGNPTLQTLPFTHLRTVGGTVQLFNNDALTSLEGLNVLTTVGGDFLISDNDALPSSSGLWSLHSVGGALQVIGNDSLQDFGTSFLSRAGSIIINGNASLATVGPMLSLKSVDKDFGISNSPKLTAVMEFPLLVSVGGILELSDNTLLTDLSAFGRLLRLEGLHVTRSPALTSLSPFSGLRELDGLLVKENPELTQLGLSGLVRVGTYFIATDNPKLPGCLATTLASSVYTGRAEDLDIARNAETACGP